MQGATYIGYEADKAIGLNACINTLISLATREFDVATFLHADMIPMDVFVFERFWFRFANSSAWLATAPMWPGHPAPSFCDLHFDFRKMPKSAFPVTIEKREPPELHYNEWYLMKHLDRVCPDWREQAYPLTTCVFPIWPQHGGQVAKHMHDFRHHWTFHNYTPETSVIHTNDENFWQNAEEICRWT